jgi:lipoyl(octanoyl) transferase
MLHVGRRFGDVRAYVTALEDVVIQALARFGVEGEKRDGRIGVWVRCADRGRTRAAKIASIGVRLRRWVSSHGFSLNVAPNLEHFTGIVPCGQPGEAVTSLADLGVRVGVEEVDQALREALSVRLGLILSAQS